MSEKSLTAYFKRLVTEWKEYPQSSDLLIPENQFFLSSLQWPDDLELPAKWDTDLWLDYFPWNFDLDPLLDFDWDGPSSPGISFSMDFWALRIPKLGTLYGENGSVKTKLLCFSDSVDPEVSDRIFLHHLIASNGSAFKSGIFGDPPTDVIINLPVSSDFLVDAFVSGFNEADAWDRLIELHDYVWDDEYENPISSLILNEAILNDYKTKYEATNGEPASLASAVVWNDRFNDWLSEKLMKFEKVSFNNRPAEIGMLSKQNKWKITERYLANVLS